MKALAVMLATAGALIAGQASATTFYVPSQGTTITATPIQTFTLGNSETTTGSFTDFYIFTLTAPLALGSSGFQTTRLDSVSNIDFTSAILYSGAGNTGTKIATFTPTGEDANGQETESLGATSFMAGTYTIALSGNTTAAPASYQGQLTLAATSSAVPEAATWAMMFAGFGIAGTALRGSRRRVTFAA